MTDEIRCAQCNADLRVVEVRGVVTLVQPCLSCWENQLDRTTTALEEAYERAYQKGYDRGVEDADANPPDAEIDPAIGEIL